MASTTLTTPIRRRLSTFARGIARPFTDSRRRNFITDMLSGLVAAGHVHLTAVARGISRGAGNIHATEKRLIADGWKSTEQPKVGRDGKWQLNLYDPDDTRTEFMEFAPKEKPCCSEFNGTHPGPK